MSLTGIAIAIGVLVDAAIVVTENVIRHCEQAEEEKRAERLTARGDLSDVTLAAVAAGRPADLLRDGDHHPRLRAGVRAHRAGGKALPPARLHQDLRDDRLDAARGDDRAGALQLCWCAAVSSAKNETSSCAVLLRIYEVRRSNWALRACASIGAGWRCRG